jgi:hypothetical protein
MVACKRHFGDNEKSHKAPGFVGNTNSESIDVHRQVPTSASERPQWVLVVGKWQVLTKSTRAALEHYVFKDKKGGKLTIFKYAEADTVEFRTAFSCSAKEGPNRPFETNVVYRQHHNTARTEYYPADMWSYEMNKERHEEILYICDSWSRTKWSC